MSTSARRSMTGRSPPPFPPLRACAGRTPFHTAPMARELHRSSGILDAVALLVIDMQDSFLAAIDGATQTTERCGFAIEAARLFGVRVVFTEQVPARLGHTHRPLTALAPDARIFAKDAFSALQAEGLSDHLRKQGIYHLLLAGLETSVCVYQTALHAHDSDFDVTVLADCVTGRRAEDSRLVLDALAHASCHVLPAETVFYSMLGSSTHPRFRQFNDLVKNYGHAGALGAARAHSEPHRPERDYAPAAETRDEFVPEKSPASAPAEFRDEPDFEPETDERTGQAPTGTGAPASGAAPGMQGERKRSRRRRGGARRRRARERAAEAAAASGGAGDQPAPYEPARETDDEFADESAPGAEPENEEQGEHDSPDANEPIERFSREAEPDEERRGGGDESRG